MKHKFIVMSLLITGPVQVSNDIYVYLHRLLDDLLILWAKGVRVCNEYKPEHFNLHAMLFVTIQLICVWCIDEYGALWLKYYKKVVYMFHHRFL
jgi:hypothetical protein